MSPLIYILGAGLGGLWLLTRGGTASAAGGGGGGTGGGGTGGGGTGGGGTGGAKTHRKFTLTDAGNTELPGNFSAKHGVSWKRFTELAAVNPAIHIVQQKQYEASDGNWVSEYEATKGAYKDDPGTGASRMVDWGLLPWENGQEVYIPDSWPG